MVHRGIVLAQRGFYSVEPSYRIGIAAIGNTQSVKRLTFSFDFLSPYAYLAAERIRDLAERHECRLVWRPVLLAGLLKHNGLLGPAEIPDKRRYIFKNICRLAHDLDIEIQPPPAHPFNPLLPLRIACLRPEGELIVHLFRACWKDGRAIDSQDALEALMDEDTRLRANSDEAKQILRDNTNEAIEEGVFGVPSVTVDGEVFWGLDSFPHLERFLLGSDPLDQDLLQRWESLPASASRR